MILKGGLFQVELMLLKVKVSEKLTSGLWIYGIVSEIVLMRGVVMTTGV